MLPARLSARHFDLPIRIWISLCSICAVPFALQSQPNFTANQLVAPYPGGFRPAANNGYYPGFTNEILGEMAQNAGARSMRIGMSEEIAELFGNEILTNLFEHYQNLGMADHTFIVQNPVDWHRDSSLYCPDQRAELFKNAHLPIWDGGANGTPYNDQNFFAAHLHKMVSLYKPYVKFWEIWNEPGFDLTGSTGWLPPGYPKNWWENDPAPCDNILNAPIEHYVRHLRIAWEIVKTVDPTAYVTCSGVGYPAFLDAVLRKTDNPNGGSVTAEFPLKGGAYFDCVGIHSYPHFDGSVRFWDNGCQCMVNARHSDGAVDGTISRVKKSYDDVLLAHGYGAGFPQKIWTITEGNVPGKPFQWGTETLAGGVDFQRNFIIKNMVALMKNNIVQYGQYQILNLKDFGAATEPFERMGLFENSPGNGAALVRSPEGTAYRTASLSLFGTSFDAARTALLGLPTGVGGGAFRQQSGKFVYVLWAKTEVDQSESAAATFSFPQGLGLPSLAKRDWDFAQTQISTTVSTQNLGLTAAPIFLFEDENWGKIPIDNGPATDLKLTLSASPANPAAGAEAIFSLKITNESAVAATNVQVRNFLEFSKSFLTDRLAFVSNSAPAGTGHDYLAGTWSIPSLAAGQSLTLDLTAKLRTAAPFRAFAQIGRYDERDSDSRPLNGAVSKTPYEDDEADVVLNDNGFLQTKPDLVVEAINQPATVAAGANFGLNLMVRNNGRWPTAAASQLKIFLSTDDVFSPGDVEIGAENIPTLASFAYQTVWRKANSLPVSTAAGSYFLIYKADAVGAVDEFEEGAANEFARPILVTNGGGGPVGDQAGDLQMTASTANPDPAQWSLFAVEFLVKNLGPVAVAGIKTGIPLPPNGGLVFKGGDEYTASQGSYQTFGQNEWAIGSLAPGASASLKINFFNLTTAAKTVAGQLLSGSPADPVLANNSASAGINGGSAGGSCSISAVPLNIVCNNAGSTANPDDDTFSFQVLVQKNGACGSGWTASDGSSGLYGTAKNFGPFPISGGNKTLTINDLSTPAASVTVTATAPLPCSTGGGQTGPDLQISMTADKATVPQWGNVRYTILAKNNGTAALQNALIGIGLCPATGAGGLFFTGDNALVFAGTPVAPSLGSFNFITQEWAIGGLAAGQSAVLVLKLFTLSSVEKKVAAWAKSQSPGEADSQPSGSFPAGCAAIQDDEAAWAINLGQSLTADGGRATAGGMGSPGFSKEGAVPGIFPNPTDGDFSLDLTLFSGKKVAVDVSDVLGKKVFSDIMNAAEEQVFDIDLAGQPDGVYFIKIGAVGQRAVVKRLIVSKL